jgi:putative membrane protein
MSKFNFVMGRFALAAAVAALPVALVGQTNSTPSGSTTAKHSKSANMNGSQAGASLADKKFVHDAAQGGMAEVELGKLATEKASSAEVKKFGQRMVDDHSKANEELKQVAGSEGIQLPAKLSAKDQMTKDRLSKLSGEQFDKAYMRDMVKDHIQDVADFKRESTSGKDSNVKSFASQTLPTLEDHLRQAKELAPPSRTASNNMKGSQ